MSYKTVKRYSCLRVSIRGKILFLFAFFDALYAASFGTNAVTMRFTTDQQILNWKLVLCVSLTLKAKTFITVIIND